MTAERTTRSCAACGGKRTCRWVDDAWYCNRCGAEWTDGPMSDAAEAVAHSHEDEPETLKWTEYAPGVTVEIDPMTGEIVAIDGVPFIDP